MAQSNVDADRDTDADTDSSRWYDTNIGKRAFEVTNVTEPFHFKALYFLKFKSDRLDNCRYRFAI